jgi:histidinol-phosphate/aromatic aminotransferase/cobyric acid decarboxylase-like protein
MEQQMDWERGKREQLFQRLRRSLPLTAYPRPALFAFLKTHRVMGRGSPRLTLVDVFDAGQDRDLMCRFTIEGETEGRGFVAPLAQLALHSLSAVAPDATLRRRHSNRASG